MSGHYETAIIESASYKSINLNSTFESSSDILNRGIQKLYKDKELQMTKPISYDEACIIADNYEIQPDNKYTFEALKLGLSGYYVSDIEYKTTKDRYTSEGLYRLKTGKKYLYHRGIAIGYASEPRTNTLLGHFKSSKTSVREFDEDIERRLNTATNLKNYKTLLNDKNRKIRGLYLFNYYSRNTDDTDYIYAEEPLAYVNDYGDKLVKEKPTEEDFKRVYYYLIAGVIPDIR